MGEAHGLIVDTNTRDLLRALAERLDAAAGRVRLELIFSDGEFVDGYVQERLLPRETECRCPRRKHRPDCPAGLAAR